MNISDLGEWGIINTIFKIIEKDKRNMLLPYGDDAIAIKCPKGKLIVINVDMLVGRTDVPPGMDAFHIGKKAVTMSVSDLAAKGAKPIGFLSSIGLRRDMSIEELKEIYRGMNQAARMYGMHILGGDTNEADDIIIDGISLGVAKNVVSRSGAKVGDIVAVTGLFGNTSLGLKILFENIYVPEKLRRKILKSVYDPKARIKEGYVLAKKRLINSAIDSSDGLAISLYEIAEKSGVGIEIDHLPITIEADYFAKKNNVDPFELVFYGGEEYELIVTLNEKNWEEALSEVIRVGGKLIKIGVVTEKAGEVIYKGERKIEKKGWQHFRQSLGDLR